MKLCVKRIYCPSCAKLVRCQEKEEGGKLRIVCNRCGGQLLSREGGNWRYVKASAE
jgi:hypothetical protein